MVINDNTPIVTLTVGQLKELFASIVPVDFILPCPKKDTMSVTEVAEMSGYSKATIYKLVCERKIPHHKPAHGGRKTVFVRSEISQWLQAKEVETLEQYATKQEQILTNKKQKQ